MNIQLKELEKIHNMVEELISIKAAKVIFKSHISEGPPSREDAHFSRAF